jgi:hypothetical protein
MSSIRHSIGTLALALSAALLAPAELACGGELSMVINGGLTPTAGTTSDYLKSGWTLGTGMMWQWDPSSPFAMQFDLSYSDFNATGNLVQVGQSHNIRTNGGSGDIWSFTAAGKYTMDRDGARGYTLLGVGAYNRHLQLTQTVYGTGYFCDPWWGYCYPGITSGDIVTASRSNTKFGLNFGLGIEFPVGEESAWFVEARYHWVDSNKATEFIPIQIGFRF